jgi:lipoprotein-anchoring transpeptidase ErfK/SrfK
MVAGCGADVETTSTTTRTAQEAKATRPALSAEPQETVKKKNNFPPGYVEPLAFHVKRRTQLRLRPDGRAVRVITPKTGFKSPRILSIANQRGDWVLVRTSVSGHRVGWLPKSSGVVFSEPRSVVIDLSRRLLTLYHRGRMAGRYRVAVGAPGTETPTGKFAITDRLRVRPGTPYGCCILALNAHQPKIAQGWGGGDRVAIHATPDTSVLGKAVSHGCVRASNGTLHKLMRRVRLGTPVTIHK